MRASKQPIAGIRCVMTTIWGDDGNECDFWSALPGIWYFAEHAYTSSEEVDMEILSNKFDGCSGGNFEAFVEASRLDDLQPEAQPADHKARLAGNMSKWLLWEDPLLAILSPQYASEHDLESHYRNLAAELANVLAIPSDSPDFGALNSRLRLPYLLSSILTLKCHLREWLRKYYLEGDLDQIELLAGSGSDTRLGRLRELVDDLWGYHRSLWMSTNKPFGWDILDLRYGGLRARLETMHHRLIAYLDPMDKSVTSIPELEVQTEPIWPGAGPNLYLNYHRASRVTFCCQVKTN